MIRRGTRDLADAKLPRDGLGEKLVVEDEVVGIGEQRHREERRARIGAEAGMEFRKFRSERQVLRRADFSARRSARKIPIGDGLCPLVAVRLL